MTSGLLADWRDEAACLHADPELFFPIGTTGPALRQVDEAKRVCLDCPVRRPCLDWALGQQEILSGIWGGTTEDERRVLGHAARAGQSSDRRAWFTSRASAQGSATGPR